MREMRAGAAGQVSMRGVSVREVSTREVARRAPSRRAALPGDVHASFVHASLVRASLVLASAALVACGRIDLGSQRLGDDAPSAEVPADASDPSTPTDVPSEHPSELPGTSTPPGAGLDPEGTLPDASTSAPGEGVPSPSPGDAGNPGSTPPDRRARSCRGVTEFCGPESEDCCLSLPVEGGEVTLPVANGARARVSVSSFRLDKYEVTVGRFRAFLAGYDEWRQSGATLPEPDVIPRAADAGAPPDAGWTGELRPAGPLPGDAAELERRVRECDTIPLSTLALPNSSSRIPLNCVNWLEAAAFCAWDGARLPTYAEWYYAAAGGTEDRVYPWGNEPTPSRVYAAYGCTLGQERPECTAAYVLPVGSHPPGAGLFGQHDLAGSMSEWLQDGAFDHYVEGCTDCAGPPLAGLRFWRSGSWVDDPWLLRNDFFVLAEQRLRLPFLGLRCARDGG